MPAQRGWTKPFDDDWQGKVIWRDANKDYFTEYIILPASEYDAMQARMERYRKALHALAYPTGWTDRGQKQMAKDALDALEGEG